MEYGKLFYEPKASEITLPYSMMTSVVSDLSYTWYTYKLNGSHEKTATTSVLNPPGSIQLYV